MHHAIRLIYLSAIDLFHLPLYALYAVHSLPYLHSVHRLRPILLTHRSLPVFPLDCFLNLAH